MVNGAYDFILSTLKRINHMNKKISKSFMMFVVLIIIYLGFIFSSDISKIQSDIANIPIANLISIIGLWSIANLVRTFRWHFFLKEIDNKVPFGINIIYYLAGFALILSPGRLGEVIRSPYLKRVYDIPIYKSASIVFVERFYDLLGIIVLLTVGLIFVEFDRTIVLAPIILVIIIAVIFKNKSIFSKILEKLSKIKPLRNIKSNYEESYYSALKIMKAKFFILGISTSIVTYFLQTLAVYFIILSLNGYITIEKVLVIYPITMFASVVTLIPGGIGVFEGGMVGLLSIYGLHYEIAITTSLLIRIIGMGLFSALGIICLRIISKK